MIDFYPTIFHGRPRDYHLKAHISHFLHFFTSPALIMGNLSFPKHIQSKTENSEIGRRFHSDKEVYLMLL